MSFCRTFINLFLLIAAITSGADMQANNPPAIIPLPQQCIIKSSKTYPLKRIINIKNIKPTHGSDEYTLSVKRGKATIGGNRHLAEETLRQLTDKNGCVPDVEIHDWAAYPIRGFMHDTGRNFQPLSMLKETIDLMARYKLNLFHWHLTDNPAWRIECKCFPQLNDAQFQRKGRDEGKFYTYDEIRELIRYASERGIMVMPEIDMPGHSQFFTRTFGFTMDSDEGKKVLKECLKEFFNEIPASMCPYFHVGSDEIHISDPHGFASWIQTLVKDSGRIPVAWDPGLPTMPFTIRQGWNEASAANTGSSEKDGRYVDSFVGYLNYYDPMMFAMRAFMHKAAAQEVPDTTKALGGILCLWNDVRVDDKRNISLHNGMIQGMMTFGERFWRGGSGNAMSDENLYPDPSSPQGKALSEMENRMMAHRNRYYSPATMRWSANASIAWHITIGDKRIKAWGGAVDLDALCKVNNIKANEQKEMIAETTLTAETDTTILVWLGFDIPARSDRMSTGIGRQGEWENGGKCIVNGIEIRPPVAWKEPDAYNYPFHTWHKVQAEEPFSNEQFYWMRPSVKIRLKKGKNHVKIVNPHSFKGQRWSFAFIPTDYE